jgi:motility quorum-sensing regulator/GCU-specific mRNA interferase toxin
MGLRPAEMVAVVLGLTAGDFYKSMTTYHDHTFWQDVYHARTPVGKTAYIKATLQAGAVVIQFKEK